jgi:NADP-dependent aldehyde dehydrogenase
MTVVSSVDPRTGSVVEVVAAETTVQEVDDLCAAALAAAPALDAMGRSGRAVLLRALADALEGRRDDVVATADRETALGAGRLNGELTRTCYQLRLFAEVLDEGSFLEATVDHAGPTPMGPRPDLRRMLVPLGPVAVFGASNFPLAFSVPGGDTASALAAGCPVVIKAHGAHPATSQLCFDVLAQAARDTGAPDGTLGLVHGLEAGARLVTHPAVRAVGFTGSLRGARSLLDLIGQRPDPIPFFGELSSLNPVVVTPAAAAERGEQIGTELVGSFTLGAGQFCTKPGLALVPQGPGGDALMASVTEAVRATGPQVMLTATMADSFRRGSQLLAGLPGMQVVARGQDATGTGFEAVPVVLQTTSGSGLAAQVTEECFGPVTVVVRYADEAELFAALGALPSSLTASILRGRDETALPAALGQRLRPLAGRIVYDGYPTGVSVAWAQHHGGPWPSTNSQHTSVGTGAVRRFLHPAAWQDAPDALLPPELRDGYREIPRRVDGRIELPGTES